MDVDGERGENPHVTLLERESQLGSLLQYADEARARSGRLVLISGEAGVGKSSLVEELQQRLPDATWAWGACDSLFTPRPLAPLHDIAREIGGNLLEMVRGAGLARRDLRRRAAVRVGRRRSRRAGGGGRAVGGRRHARPAPLPGSPGREAPGAAAGDVPRRRARPDRPTPGRPRRAGRSALHPAHRPAAAHARRRTPPGRGHVVLPRRAVRAHRWQPVLRGRGAAASRVPRYPPSARDAVLARAARLSDAARATLDLASLDSWRVDPHLVARAGDVELETFDELVVGRVC